MIEPKEKLVKAVLDFYRATPDEEKEDVLKDLMEWIGIPSLAACLRRMSLKALS